MKIRIFLLLSVIFTLPHHALRSQDTPDGLQVGIHGFWEVITASGRFMARLDQIASVTEHTYVIDGAVRV